MDLLSICQEVYDEVFPNPSVQNAVKVEHVIEVGKSRYAVEMWLQSKLTAREDGYWEVPSTLWREATLTIENNEADISALKIFRSFEGDLWANIGGGDCDCEYMRQSLNVSKMLCDDEYLGNAKPYTPIGKKIKFPKGAHAATIPIIYASNGMDLDNEIEVDDVIGGLVSDYLWKRFANKLPVDRTVDSNENK